MIKEWTVCNQAITVSFFLFVQDTLSKLQIFYVMYFPVTHFHSDCHNSNISLFARDFKSEKEMSSTEMSPARASLAAESAAELPLMPT